MIEIHGIHFDVQWDKFEPHSSFFIPCLDTKEAKRIIKLAVARYKFKVRMKTTTKDKVRGIRVWRVE
jgi:hypothetical protein|tara:strand:- start:24 stop:224 length:201 start_codon:yes stop_codon:yes gene_type:complete